jgi:hypothetical protein
MRKKKVLMTNSSGSRAAPIFVPAFHPFWLSKLERWNIEGHASRRTLKIKSLVNFDRGHVIFSRVVCRPQSAAG